VLRETIESQIEKEDDGIAEQVEEEEAELHCSMPTCAALMDNPTPSSSIAEYMRRNYALFSRNANHR
jgi:hypothetical protein